MAFSPRLISRKGLPGSSSWLQSTARMNTATTTRSPSAISPPSKIQHGSSFSSPWLTLPPSVNVDDAGSISYNFYSLGENLVRTVAQKEFTGFAPDPIHDLMIRGSSHGWLAMFNRNRDPFDLFLYNPISLRRINLPPFQNLPPYPKCNGFVYKVILSCSPDEDEHNCRAVMIHNGVQPLASCCPGRSKEWTPFGTTINTMNREYRDVVYSSRQNLFFGLSASLELETWDLSDPSSPRMIPNKVCFDSSSGSDSDGKHSDSDSSDGADLSPEELSYPSEYLVVAHELFSEDEDDILLLTRYEMESVAPDGSYHDYFAPLDRFPHVTIGFDIDVYDREEGKLKGVDSLGDLALFIGSPSESAALSATRFPELKPNSIYFTDQYTTISDLQSGDEVFGGHDIGIFNYENKTVSPCYYPCDVPSLKRISPSPVWFYPRGPV